MSRARGRLRRRWATAVCAALFAAGALVGCSGSAGPAATVIPLPTALPAAIPYDDAMRLFEYDHSLPYAVKEIRVTDEAGATVVQITYSLGSGTRTLAYFVFPRGSGPFGAVMFLPGGQRGPEEFMDEALDLASHGVASLLIKEPELNPMPLTDADAVTNIIFEMRELRRALDLLASRPEVDAQRLGVVGVSFGAVRAGTFAGIEGRRLTIAVLASTPASYNFAPMAPFDPVVWAPHVSPAALYVQEGTEDTWFTHAEAESLIAVARAPKKLVWYSADHGLNGDAYNDRQGWLIAALGPR